MRKLGILVIIIACSLAIYAITMSTSIYVHNYTEDHYERDPNLLNFQNNLLIASFVIAIIGVTLFVIRKKTGMKVTPPPFPNQKKNGSKAQLSSTAKAVLSKKISVGYIILIFLIGAFCIYGGYKIFSVPKEFKPLCERYKIFFDPLQKCYIFKLRGSPGGYNIYKDGDKFYCKMEVAFNSREMIYHGDSYPTVERAMEAVELGLVDNRKINYDDNLDIEYMGEFNGNGLTGHYKSGSTKKRCDVICE